MRPLIHPQSGLPPYLRGFQIYPVRESRGHDLSHTHQFIELHYCEAGRGFIQIGSARYPLKPGLITLLYAPVPHRIYSATHSIYRRKVIHFPMALPSVHFSHNLGDILPLIPTGHNPCLQFLLKPEDRERLFELLKRGYDECSRWHQESQANISQILSEVILILKGASPFFAESAKEEATPHERLLVMNIENMITSYDSDGSDILRISALSDYFGMSPGHIRRVYAKVRRSSLREFVLTTKLSMAEATLRKGGTVTDAAMAGLYTNVGSFSRTFKKRMGVSPRVYQSWLTAVR